MNFKNEKIQNHRGGRLVRRPWRSIDAVHFFVSCLKNGNATFLNTCATNSKAAQCWGRQLCGRSENQEF